MASRNPFCPYCNSKGESQPILSSMVCAYVLDRRAAVQGEDTERHPSRDVLEPHYEYRCERCGFTEIHDNRLGEAA